MPAWITAILEALAKIFGLLQNQQLLNAGKAEANLDVSEENSKAQETAHNVIIDNNKLGNDALSAKLQKWKRSE